jgi:hypothetical protein
VPDAWLREDAGFWLREDGFKWLMNGAGVRWDRDNAHDDLSISSDGLTLTRSIGGGTDRSARATQVRGTGHYWEVTITAQTGSLLVGIDNGTLALNDFPGDTPNSVGWAANGNVYNNAGSVATWSTYTTGDTLGLLWKGGKFYGRKGTGAWEGGADPVAGTGGITPSGAPTNVYPVADIATNTDNITANFGASAFVASLISGATSWDGSQSGTTTTTVTVTAATMAFSGQAITVNAKYLSAITAGVMTYAGQAIGVKKTFPVIAGVMTYAAQAIEVSASKLIAVTAAAMSYAGQAVAVVPSTIFSISNSTLGYIGQSVLVSSFLETITWLGNQLGLREKD